MIGRNKTILALSALVIFFLGLGYLAKPAVKNRVPSSFDSSYLGLKALFMLLEKEQVEVERWQVPFTELDPTVSMLVVTPSLFSLPVKMDEWEKLESWIRGGGTLFHAPSSPKDRLTRNLQIKIGPRSPRIGLEEAIAMGRIHFDETAWDKLVEKMSIEDPGLCLPSGAGIFPRRGTGFTSSDDQLKKHVAEEGRIGFASREFGKGHIFVLGDSFVLSNLGLRKGENAAFVTCLFREMARTQRKGVIAFDEYHHGYQTEQTFSAFTNSPPAQALMFQAVLISILGLAAYGVRFGLILFRPQRRERRATEFVESLAHLYEKRDLKIESSELLADELRRRICRSAGYPTNVALGELEAVCTQMFGREGIPDLVEQYLTQSRVDAGYRKRSFLPFHQLIYALRKMI